MFHLSQLKHCVQILWVLGKVSRLRNRIRVCLPCGIPLTLRHDNFVAVNPFQHDIVVYSILLLRAGRAETLEQQCPKHKKMQFRLNMSI